ncbi:MAG TPA: tetratricopeptide repeat protein, partial [Bacteroidetes bacterium]|nr:tetratricopeptide repeat protein [Bacteroidota bacterium]
MENPDQHIVDEYLLGNLSGEELASFEKKLEKEEALQAAVEDRKDLIAAVDALGDIQMKERVRRIHERATNKTTVVRQIKPRRINFRAYAAAAVALVAIGLSLWIWLRPPLNERLYADFFEPYSISFSSRGNDADQKLSEAGRLYNNGDYINAIPVLEKLLNEEINNKDGVLLATGISYMELGEYENAARIFENIIDKKGSPYYEQGVWYLALVALEENDIDGCKRYLGLLVEEEDGFYYDRASAF